MLGRFEVNGFHHDVFELGMDLIVMNKLDHIVGNGFTASAINHYFGVGWNRFQRLDNAGFIKEGNFFR